MVSLARKNLFHDRLRFVITVAGVAFAVTLVLVQVGLFMGLLDKSMVTIRHASADLWITSHNTPNVDFARTFPETAVLRARSVPGVARADNLIVAFMNIQLPNGAAEGALVYALEDFASWNLPWNVPEGSPVDLKRGYALLMDGSAALRYGPFATGDGGSVFLSVQNEREFARFCELVLRQQALSSDPRFAGAPARMENRDALQREIERVFSALSAAQVLERLEQAGIANARLNSMAEFWRHPQLVARGRWAKVGSPAGEIDALKPPFNLSDFDPRMDPIPALGEHSRTILAELGYSATEIDRLQKEKAL